MSVEALWAVEFGHAGANFQPVNAGTAVLESGRVLGGDSWFAYVGDYTVDGNALTASLRVSRHKADPASIDAWGTGDDVFDVSLRGDIQPDGRVIGIASRPPMQIGFRMRRIAELP